MSTLRKIVVSTAAVFLAVTGTVLTAGTASGDCDWNIVQCRTAN
jgi:hypothetical protein